MSKPELSDIKRRAGNLISQGRVKEASELILCSSFDANDDPEMQTLLGIAYSRLNDKQKALQCFQRALQLNPNSAASHYNLGAQYVAVGMKAEAIQMLQRAAQMDPTHQGAKQMLNALTQEQTQIIAPPSAGSPTNAPHPQPYPSGYASAPYPASGTNAGSYPTKPADAIPKAVGPVGTVILYAVLLLGLGIYQLTISSDPPAKAAETILSRIKTMDVVSLRKDIYVPHEMELYSMQVENFNETADSLLYRFVPDGKYSKLIDYKILNTEIVGRRAEITALLTYQLSKVVNKAQVTILMTRQDKRWKWDILGASLPRETPDF